VGPYCVIGPRVVIGDDTYLHNGVTIQGRTIIGRENVVFPYAVLGAPPQDLKYGGSETELRIGDSNTIREYVTMNVGTEPGGGVTSVGDANLFMAVSHVAHDCRIGDGCIISNEVLLAGHIHVGDAVVLSGSVAIHHFVSVGEYAFVGGLSRIVSDVPPFLITEGGPGEARAVNVVGLRRNGFSDEAIEALEAAYRAVYRSGEPMSRALSRIDEAETTPEVARLVEFLKNRLAGKHGRALQP